MRFNFSNSHCKITCCTSEYLVSTALKVKFLHSDNSTCCFAILVCGDLTSIFIYLLYIRMSGFHSADGGIRTSSTFPYSLVFHAKLTSSHSWREKKVRNQVQLRFFLIRTRFNQTFVVRICSFSFWKEDNRLNNFIVDCVLTLQVYEWFGKIKIYCRLCLHQSFNIVFCANINTGHAYQYQYCSNINIVAISILFQYQYVFQYQYCSNINIVAISILFQYKCFSNITIVPMSI